MPGKWAGRVCRRDLFPVLMVGLFRRDRFGTRNRMARQAIVCRFDRSCGSRWTKACRIIRTISRTRRLMDVETHQAVFQWVLALCCRKESC